MKLPWHFKRGTPSPPAAELPHVESLYAQAAIVFTALAVVIASWLWIVKSRRRPAQLPAKQLTVPTAYSRLSVSTASPAAVDAAPLSKDPLPGAKPLHSSVPFASPFDAPLYYPVYAVRVERVLELERMLPHEELVESGDAQRWERGQDGPLLFISHQWTAFREPDPTGTQFALLKAVLRHALDGTLVASSADEDHASSFVPLSDALRDARGAWVWLDLWSIPQKADATTQMLGIKSIPAYIESARCMLCLVPRVTHRDTGEVCDASSYSQRGTPIGDRTRNLTA